ncbi:MAG: hypothetical protein H7270_04890 [Dermatophilaceae bacterium]|nr:hypothetical protein [Dermatophilaceae bacterium]
MRRDNTPAPHGSSHFFGYLFTFGGSKSELFAEFVESVQLGDTPDFTED